MNKQVPVITRCLHVILIRRCTPDGKIDRRRLFEIIAERVGKIAEHDKNKVVKELEECGVILESDKCSFVLNMSV